MDLITEEGELLRRFTISTSRFGLGFEPGSNKTPTGIFRIESKWGEGAAEGEIFVSRQATGRTGNEQDPEDHVQTRILWLEGLEEKNANTHSRYIYIHGTNAEGLLGTPASHGCVRMSNAEVIELFNLVNPGTLVSIVDANEV
jgi:lipoprotein-anchoring transpeptidase ErfK/SrfK